MTHRSLPPSATSGARLLPPTYFKVMRQTPGVPAVSVVPLPVHGTPRVRVFPSPDGTVLMTGVTLEGHWVCEYRCLKEDFDERCVRAMERKVITKERAGGPRLVK